MANIYDIKLHNSEFKLNILRKIKKAQYPVRVFKIPEIINL